VIVPDVFRDAFTLDPASNHKARGQKRAQKRGKMRERTCLSERRLSGFSNW